ncbi:MAG: HAMP domain-containing histidine kinase [Fusobacteriaceae bacterium]|jgi:signal transduction histidine kinase|nr:HAMP domain-containing histidine kinase [Fusobacteriaceae bacterium]
MNVFFLDKFLIYQKKNAILSIKEIAKEKLYDPVEFANYVENVRDNEGIDIVVVDEVRLNLARSLQNMPSPINQGTLNRFSNRSRPRMPQPNWETGKFHMTRLPNTNITLLFYNESIPDVGIMSLRTSLSVIKVHKAEINFFNIIITGIGILFSMIIGRILCKKITGNIEKLNSIARKISVLDFSEKSDIHSEDEIGELSRSIDTMSENLENSIENLRTFASDASHELKTPITVISTHAQGLIGGLAKTEAERMKYYKAIAKKSKEMNEIITNLLTISRLSSPGIRLDRSEADFMSFFRESAEKYENIELEKDLRWEVDLPGDNTVFCDGRLFGIAIDNIVQNALRYSVDEGTIRVYRQGAEYVFENETDGLLPEKLEQLWEPFARGANAEEKSREGNGLGLSIVRRIFELNGFSCRIAVEGKKFILAFNTEK